MNLKRIVSSLLLLSLLLSLALVAQAAERGVSLSSDSSFFAQLNLNTAGMEKVKAAVSAGNYTTAKAELLQYYKTKFASYDPIPADSKDATRVFFAMNDTWSMSENRIAETTIQGTGFNFYSFGKTNNTAGCYVLDILDRPDYAIQICTRENEVESHRPVLKCYDASNNLISEVVAAADAMIHKGKPDTNYGTDNVLYVKSGMTQNSDGTYLPYNINSRRVYMRFNVPSGTKYTELVIYARLHGASAGEDLSLPLYQFDSFNKSWTESNLTWNYLVKLKAMGHYSWKDIPGAFDWKQPEGVGDYDWLDSNARFYELVAIAQTAAATTDATQKAAYLAKLKEILLDFIADTTVRTGFPANRDRETSSRMMNFPYIYKQLLAGNALTANENKTILAYVYDELIFMDNGATIFDNVNGNHGASAYTNHSVYHLAGFYSALAYWPEFKSNASWRSRYESRVDFVLTTLINSDGSYNEVTFGYPRGVLSTNSFLMYCMQERGDSSATGKKFINASILLARYLMDCSYPNGKNPYWGEGSTTSAISGHIKTFLSYLGNGYDNDPNVKALRHLVSNTEGTAPDTVAQYTPVKIVTDRTGWSSADSMLFMNAKCAGYHGHRDALAILYYYGGRSLLTDTGTTSASSSHPHYNFQHNSTRSHNTIEIDGKAQTWQKLPSAGANMGEISIAGNDSYSSISSWTKANTNDISTTNASGATVTHSTDFTHYRHVSYMKALGEILFVSDKVVPADSASHSYTQNWHSAPYSNPTIAADAYDTGRTAFSSGPNLLIAQVNGDGMTGSLQTGYDSSASATTTKYFQYKKTGSGTMSYQTVLYPMAEGTTATVQPTKITMSGTNDATAVASRIAVNDSSRPTVKSIYHYHAFEATPATRSFDAFTTNAGTVTLVQDGSSKLHFAALAKGSSVSSGSTVILKAAVTVTDLAATLENGVLSVESSDPAADFATITVNSSGQTVKEVRYNGEAVAYTQAGDGTVTIRGQYPLVHFDGEGLLSDGSQWTPHACTAAIKNGTMTGSLTAADPYVKSEAAFAYPLQKGDVVDIRVKYNITSGAYTGLQFFWLTEAAPQYNATNRLLHSATSYSKDTYNIIRLSIPDSSVGDVMTGLRVDPVGTGTSNLPVGSYTIDYIYVGPASTAPSTYTDSLLFDFKNDRSAELRYTASVYGDRNYDTGNWHGNRARNSVAYFGADAMYYSVVDGISATYLQSSHDGSMTGLPLSYIPKAGDWVQIRLRLENMCTVPGSSPDLSLFYLKNNVSAEVAPEDNTPIKGVEAALNGQYVTLSAALTDSFTKATAINSLRVTLSGMTNVSGKVGRVYIDYIAIGSRDQLPEYPVLSYTVTFKDAAGKILATQEVNEGGTATYSGSTPTKAYDGTYHYSFKGWDKALTNIQADTILTAQFTATAHSYTYAKVDNTNHKGTCSCGYSKTSAHGWNNGSITSQPTCTAAGVKTYTCSTCKGTKTEAVAALGHSYTNKVTAPTCTAQGYTTHTCSRCSNSYKDTYTNALGHNYTNYKATTAPTTSATGVLTGTCSRCSATTTVTLPKLNTTDYTKTTTTAATCTATGVDKYTWKTTTYGSFSFNATTAALGHSYTTKVTAPTCTAQGYTTHTCSRCSHSYKDTYTNALGHNYTNYKATTAPTTSATGVLTGTCSRCSATTTVTLPKLNTT
ncbi:MAG: heparinase II/III family protein, partial [Oscillospiraceae bacterium]|nr:heparinase II/III family protein [Oscillospiraceae bacterium]